MTKKVYIEQHLSKLGYQCRDKVTGYSGVIASVTFDLYGCIQAIVTPQAQPDGKPIESSWFDISRLEIIGDAPVMAPPDFISGDFADGSHGPADKPPSKRF